MKSYLFLALVLSPFVSTMQPQAVAQTHAQSSATQPGKSPIHGLVSMGYQYFVTHGGIPDDLMLEVNAHPDVYSAAVMNVTWSQIEPTRGHFDFSFIDHGLSEVRAYNAKHPAHPITAKLRISSGQKTPAWAMSLGGPSFQVFHHSDVDHAYTVPRYWTPEYRKAWHEAQDALAARYDAEPLVQEVAISSCSLITDEPFVPASGADSSANQKAAGLTDAVRQDCLMHAWDDYSAWKVTPLDYTVNPYALFDGPERVPDIEFTYKVMAAFRAALGRRAVIGNHGLQNPLKDVAVPLYAEMTKLGAPLEMQFYNPRVNIDPTMQLAIDHGATEIEVWESTAAKGLCAITYDQLKHWAAALQASFHH
jgi:hypothetical protein